MNKTTHYGRPDLRMGAGLIALALLLGGCSIPARHATGGREPGHDFRELAAQGLDSRSPFHGTVQGIRSRLGGETADASLNRIAILNDGEDALAVRLHLIRHATRSIAIQTFIWTHDAVGELFMRELIAAARRGVKVRVLADHFGVPKDPAMIAYLETIEPNLEIRIYRPPARALDANPLTRGLHLIVDFKGANQRMHNKTFIVDGIAGITGGRNYEDSYFNQSGRLNFKDRDALVIGPAATQMLNSFEQFWASRHTVAGRALRDVAAELTGTAPGGVGAERGGQAGARVRAIVASANASDAPRRIHASLLAANHVSYSSDLPGKNASFLLNGGGLHTTQLSGTLRTAEREILIQSPYLILSPRGERFFKSLRRMRPDLSIVVSTNSLGSTDNLFAYSANVRLREAFVNNLGFRIHEYKPHPADLRRILPNVDALDRLAADEEPFLCLHGKSIVIDGLTTYIGTFNLDPRSENLNTEGGLIIRDAAIASEVRKDILRDTNPANSWIMAPVLAPEIAAFTAEIDSIGRLISDLLPVDIVPPLNSISAFELRAGHRAVAPDHPDFHRNYRNIGRWPTGHDELSEKEILTRLLHTTAKSATPLF